MKEKRIIKLSASQIYAVEYLQKHDKVFVSFNSHLHAATVKSLIKYGIAKRVGGGYISLSDSFKEKNKIK